jgi:hypothetical protein
VDAAHVIAAQIRAEHDGIIGIPTEVLLVQSLGEELDVSPTAEGVFLLFVLDGELNNEVLFLVAERFIQLGRDGVELHVIRSEQALFLLSVDRPFSGLPAPLAGVTIPPVRYHPAVAFERIRFEVVFKVHFGTDASSKHCTCEGGGTHLDFAS